METINQYQTIELQSDIPVSLLLPSGKTLSTIPFQKNNRKSYIRFSCSDTGIITVSTGQKYTVKKYTGKNRLFLHGPIQREKRHLRHEDGTFFFYLADTWWYAMTGRTSMKDLCFLLKDRKKKGFTAVQIVVGVTPEVPFFSIEAANEGGHPFTKDYQINPAYFDEVDKKIEQIVKHGIVPCIFGGWGHHMDVLGVDGELLLWKEILARYSSYPVMFCLTGEADLGTQIFSRWKRISSWNKVGESVKKYDFYNRILMVHPHKNMRASRLFNNPSWLDIDSIQSGHSEESRTFMISVLREAADERVPIINLEPWYEGIRGNFGVKHQIEAFNISIDAQACGHSYGAHGVWQMASGDNFMGHWGASDWKIAYMLPGGSAIGRAAKAVYNKHAHE